jgi:RNA polymerase sigma factor (sigma-70 family)
MKAKKSPSDDAIRASRERFEALCRNYGERARRFARLKIGAALRRRIDSEDLLQDAYLDASRLFAEREELRSLDGEPFIRWLAEIIHRKALNLARHHVAAQRRSVHREQPLDAAREPAGGRTASDVAMGAEDIEELEKALSKLSPREREVVVLVHLEGLRVSEAAARMGKTANAASVLLHEALSKLEKILGRRTRRTS